MIGKRLSPYERVTLLLLIVGMFLGSLATLSGVFLWRIFFLSRIF